MGPRFRGDDSGGVTPYHVLHILQPPLLVAAQIVHQQRQHLLRVDVAHPADARRNNDILHVPERAVVRQRLLLEYVEARAAEMARLQRRDQRLLVHHRPAREIDQNAARLHRAEHARIDQMRRARRQRHQQNHEIGERRRLRQLHALHQLLEMRRAVTRVAHPDDAHAERDAARRKLPRDRADADDHRGLSEGQPLRPALPGVRRLIALHAVKIARQRDHRQKRKLRHLRPVNAARRGDQHVRLQCRQRLQAVGAGRHRADVAQPRHATDELVAHVMRHRQQDLGFGAAAERHLLIGRVVELDGRTLLGQRGGLDVSAAVHDQSTHAHLQITRSWSRRCARPPTG